MKIFWLNAYFRISVIIAATLFGALAPAAWAAPYAYIPNETSNTVSVIDTGSNAVVATVPVGQYPWGVAVSPDGSRVYVTNEASNTVSVIDAATHAVVATVPVGQTPYGVAVSPDSRWVYVANYGANTVSVIDAATNNVTATVPVGQYPYDVAVSPDSLWVYATNDTSATVSVINAATNTVVATVPVGIDPKELAVSPDGSRVYVTNYISGTVSVINTATNTVVSTVTGVPYASGVAVSPDGSRVYVTDTAAGTVLVINTATNAVTAVVTVGSQPAGVAVSPDGNRIYVANYGANTVSVINAASNTVVTTVSVGSIPISFGEFVGPGALIATNSSASGSAGSQVSGTVPNLVNKSLCTSTEATVQGPRHGSVNFDGNTGDYTYTPASATYSGPDSFTWSGQASLSCLSAYNPTLPVSNTAAVTLSLNPLLTGLGNLVVAPGATSQEAFSLTGSTPFAHTLASDNATVLPPAGVTIEPAACGTVGNLRCTLAITAAAVPGTASVSVTATDKYGDTVKKTMQVRVAAAPKLSGLSNLSVTAGQSGTESFTDTGTGTLTVTVSSSNATLLPNSGISGQSACTGAGSCTLTLQPAANQSGTVTVTVTVADNYGQSTTGTFDMTVKASGSASTTGSGGGGALSMLSLLGLLGLIALAKRRRAYTCGSS